MHWNQPAPRLFKGLRGRGGGGGRGASQQQSRQGRLGVSSCASPGSREESSSRGAAEGR